MEPNKDTAYQECKVEFASSISTYLLKLQVITGFLHSLKSLEYVWMIGKNMSPDNDFLSITHKYLESHPECGLCVPYVNNKVASDCALVYGTLDSFYNSYN